VKNSKEMLKYIGKILKNSEKLKNYDELQSIIK
jgi:hypothetical protein